MLSPKDPGETITVTFDFSTLCASVSLPSMAASVVAGPPDATPSAILSGSPQTSGALVMQKIVAGQANTTYELRCTATAPDSSVYVLAAELPIVVA